MKKLTYFILCCVFIFTLPACNFKTDLEIEKENAINKLETSTNEFSTDCNSKTELEIARENVINKWGTSANEFGTEKYIEDIYKQYPNDDVISNIYFYSIAKSQYEHYKSLNNSKYLEKAKEYAENIDPYYTGEFSEEIHDFTNKLLNQTIEEKENIYSQAKQKTDIYNNLTNSEKKEICDFIQSRYDYYDSISGGYSGDRYTDIIWQEASEKYGLTTSQLDIIWMNMYKY